MQAFLEVVTGLLVAVAMGLALAHALEFPGKMRLDRQQYFVVQQIYYPGFTIGGGAEPAAILATLVLVVITPFGTAKFWLVVIALLAMTAMQIVFWVVTQPVNRIWVKDIELSRSAEKFFAADRKPSTGTADEEWTQLRDRWEQSHVLRAALGVLGLASFLTAIVLS